MKAISVEKCTRLQEQEHDAIADALRPTVGDFLRGDRGEEIDIDTFLSEVSVMSYMFEVYYKPPPDLQREAMLTNRVERLGGHLSFREDPDEQEMGAVCLTYEFDDLGLAAMAADSLRQQGEHVEGPVDYGS